MLQQNTIEGTSPGSLAGQARAALGSARPIAGFVPLAIGIFAGLLILAAALHAAYYAVRAEGIRTEAFEDARSALMSAEDRIEADLVDVAADLAYLGREPSLAEYLANSTREAISGIEETYIALADAKAKYDQMRFIDVTGQEIVRVKSTEGVPLLADPEKLPHSVLYYFVSEVLELPPGEYYISRFDLTVEGQKIEMPLKPVIRFALPVHDASGSAVGAVILNYLGQRVLDRVESAEMETGAEIWLVNAQGDWMSGPEDSYDWNFMYPDRGTPSFAEAYPRIWEALQAEQSGIFRTEGKAFIHRRIDLERSAANIVATDPRSWTLVAHVDEETYGGPVRALRQTVLSAFGATSMASAFVALFAAQTLAGRREAQRLQKKAENNLRRSEARLRVLLETMPDGVVVVDEDGIIQRINARTEELFGYGTDALTHKPIELLLPERLRAVHATHRRHYSEEPRVRNMGEGLALAGLRADGSEFPISVSLSPVETDEGNRVIASIRDITAQRETEKHIQHLNDKLVRDNNTLAVVNHELEAFSASVSHDLRSPLRAIDGFSKALLEDYPDQLDDTGRFYLDRIRNGAQRMGLLIDDLLDLSRISRVDLVEQEVDLTALARQTAEELIEAEPDRDVTFAIDENMRANGDRRLLSVVLHNLIGNAHKFTSQRADARVEVGTEKTGAKTVYFVRDNGAGFDMAYVDNLFSAFKRLHDAREFPGTGVGLATVQRIIHKHGGRIWAEAKVDEGACFRFTLKDERLT